LTVVLLSKSFI